ncbi:hypothetical protein BGZ61DRAFT_234647 [Ilyonectria robusta]|uniref:uncharacterized protein n=1 Tax=Ilyonectria robusta TaxID=1079257 RepID=UPI001E8EF038|nr:uncharacterized protein BGZ61DRAFT_234647 [Ilyonectria robusta]KAH8699631.1 hypothetical protein BGZ61DRAFT_234647 [Ilyonectria robusta]
MERWGDGAVRRAQRQQTPVALHNALHGPAQCSDRHATSADIVNSTRAARSRVQHETWQRARCDCRLGESGQIKRRRSSRPKEQLCKPRNLSISPCIYVSISYLWHLSQLCGRLEKKYISCHHPTLFLSELPEPTLESVFHLHTTTNICVFIHPAVTVTVAVHLRLGPADPPSPYRRPTGHNPCAVPLPGRR